MDIVSWEELTSPDPRTLRFTPLGLATSGQLSPASAAEFQQQVLASSDLVDQVPDSTRRPFDRLRQLHSYGVLFYDAFTVASDSAWLVLELALRDRFIDYYGGVIPFRECRTREQVALTATAFSVVDDAFHKGGPHKKGVWGLPSRTGDLVEFRGTMGDLYQWARAQGLLDGQRTAALEPLFIKTRNHVAHPTYRLTTPVESALAITDLAETINRLWGCPTPGGRLYPAPVRREVMVVTWSADCPGHLNTMRADQLKDFYEPGAWTCLIVLAVPLDSGIWEFDAQFERTNYPAELLWGPGPTTDAVQWLQHQLPTPDEVDYIDRLFAVRIRHDEVALPQRPEVAAGLIGADRDGQWMLVRADHPNDAYAFARANKPPLVHGEPVETAGAAASGVAYCDDWARLVDVLRLEQEIMTARPTSNAHVPRLGEAEPPGSG